jgi:hypothetical protein
MSAGDDFFAGGLPSAKFDVQGKVIGGRITRVGDPMQQRDMATGQPQTWDDGKPKLQLPIDVQTDERDPEVPGDTGQRTIYVKGDLKRAITEALRKAGVQGAPKVGGVLEVAWTGIEAAKTRGFNDKKLYSARYTAPLASDPFFGQDAPAAQQVAPAPAQPADPWGSAPPAQQPVTVPAGPANGTNPFASDEPAPF